MPTGHAWSVAGKRSVAAVILVLLPLAPSLLLAPLGLGAATGTFALGAAAGLIAGLMVNLRFGVAVAVVVGIANLVALPAAPYAIPAGLVMAAVAMLYGLTARRGLTAIIVVAPESVAFTLAEPPQVLAHQGILVNALVVGGVALVGGLWGAGAGAIIGRRLPHKKPVGVSTRRAVTFAVTMAAVTGVTMAVVVAMQLQHGGAWILLTILLVAQPRLHQTWSKTLERLLGTVLGFAIALAIGLVVDSPGVVVAVGLLFVAVAVYLHLSPKRPYWQYTMVLTPGIVLVEGSGSSVVSTDVARLWFTAVGASIALVVVAVLRWRLGPDGPDEEHLDDATVTPASS